MMPWALEQPEVAAAAVDLTKARVWICTPTRGRHVNDNHRACVDYLRQQLRDQVLPLNTVPPLRDGEQVKLCTPQLLEDAKAGVAGVLSHPHDLARTRDRGIRLFLEKTTADWMIFWDDDVWNYQPHVTLASMLTVAIATDSHVVGALYPGKRRDDEAIIAAVLRGEKQPLKHAFTLSDMRFSRRPDFNPPQPHPWLAPCNGVGFGFCIISRLAAIALTEHYRATLAWKDSFLGGMTVGLCHEILVPQEHSFSEDYSFCKRAEEAGFPIYAFLGPGSPMVHDGMDSFEADPKCLRTVKVPDEK